MTSWAGETLVVTDVEYELITHLSETYPCGTHVVIVLTRDGRDVYNESQVMVTKKFASPADTQWVKKTDIRRI